MKEIGCKTVSKEIDELESCQLPGAKIQAHLQTCGSCRSFYDDRQKLRQMIAGLETVEAPGDFDFRLRARLANLRAEPVSAFSSFGFGLPSIALAVLAILVGVGLYMRATNDFVNDGPLAQSEAPITVTKITAQPTSSVDPNSPELTASREAATTGADKTAAPVKERIRRKANRSSKSNAVRRDDFVAKSETSAMFPLEAAEPLRVSVDYATGGSRTISLPAVSFGSQQVVASGASMVKTSARTVW